MSIKSNYKLSGRIDGTNSEILGLLLMSGFDKIISIEN